MLCCLQLTTNGKIIIVSESPFPVPEIDTATFHLGKFSHVAAMRLIHRLAPDVMARLMIL